MCEHPEHPCFCGGFSEAARIHLPVAPLCNIQCKYCLRRYDCVNESRPGVCSRVLSPEEAVSLFLRARQCVPHLNVVGIAGPGDALANFPAVAETLMAVRRADPAVLFCLSTNGLRLPEYLPELIRLGVSYLTVTVNAMRAEVGVQIYDYVQDGTVRLFGKEAFQLLWSRQQEGVREAAARGLHCKINTIVLPGINEGDAAAIARWAGGIGCTMQNLIPLIPVAGTVFAGTSALSYAEVRQLRQEYGRFIPQMQHCQRCRADAIGMLTQDVAPELYAKGGRAHPSAEM